MFKYLGLILSIFWINISFADTLSKNKSESQIETPLECSKDEAIIIKNHDSLLWFRDSAEMKAIYRQIFANSIDKIDDMIESNNLKPKTWGVVMALDGTLLDDSGFEYKKNHHCLAENITTRTEYQTLIHLDATPGAADFSCQIHDRGGKVFIVTNRNGADDNGRKLIDETIANLKQENICFDSILFANGNGNTNKNPRFNAITSGDYENMIVTTTQVATPIIAFVGSDIQDFPNLKQNISHDLDGDSEYFDDFGEKYFLLPNPTYGSWQENTLH